jgi:hypothetical protein
MKRFYLMMLMSLVMHTSAMCSDVRFDLRSQLPGVTLEGLKLIKGLQKVYINAMQIVKEAEDNKVAASILASKYGYPGMGDAFDQIKRDNATLAIVAGKLVNAHAKKLIEGTLAINDTKSVRNNDIATLHDQLPEFFKDASTQEIMQTAFAQVCAAQQLAQ